MNRKSIQLIIKALDDKPVKLIQVLGSGQLLRTVPRTRRAKSDSKSNMGNAKFGHPQRGLKMISSDVMALCSINTGCGTMKRRAASISIGQSGSNDQ